MLELRDAKLELVDSSRETRFSWSANACRAATACSDSFA